ncbi:beta-lactamase family protein [Mobiluncus curtisii]|uniref:beta-lactamase family protein n=1 Tax=Mobiluncus curtisii TaxID=2051 RepID=UPI002093DAB1|nr:beta-lactamase family protein [Mobiluncus curtisii]
MQLGISRPDARAIAPFTKRIYSNYNFELAGAIAEKVVGKSWTDWVREAVFRASWNERYNFVAFSGVGCGRSCD